jgi:hypothetical protein
MLKDLLQYRQRIIEKRDAILPKTRWMGEIVSVQPNMPTGVTA